MPEFDHRSCTVKKAVLEKYDAIAQGQQDSGYCMVDEYDYTQKSGYLRQADLGLSCGIPVNYADLKPGETVLDLGSGAGLDALIAAGQVGESGSVIGIDFSPSMVSKARQNAASAGIRNTVFYKAEIEQLPMENASVDVVISNCTLNLVPDKVKAYSEIARVLRSGGRFIISDVVTVGDPALELLRSAEELAGCVNGALDKEAYMELIASVGFIHFERLDLRSLNVIQGLDGLASLTLRGWQS